MPEQVGNGTTVMPRVRSPKPRACRRRDVVTEMKGYGGLDQGCGETFRARAIVDRRGDSMHVRCAYVRRNCPLWCYSVVVITRDFEVSLPETQVRTLVAPFLCRTLV